MRVIPSPPDLASAVAVLALAAGIGVWGAIVWAPSPPAAPPTATGDAALQTDTGPVARWFGVGAGARIQVTVAGLIAAGPHGAAVLGIDGRPPRAYAVGNELADGVVLAEVRGTGVVLDQGGDRVEVQAAALPAVSGIRSVPMSARVQPLVLGRSAGGAPALGAQASNVPLQPAPQGVGAAAPVPPAPAPPPGLAPAPEASPPGAPGDSHSN